MNIKKITAVIMSAAFALSMTACGKNEEPSHSGKGTVQTGGNSTKSKISTAKEKELEYKYDSKLGGMVVTNYLTESRALKIPDTLEGEPVVKVALDNCERDLRQIIMPDSVKQFSFSSTIRNALEEVNIPGSVTTISKGAFLNCGFTSIDIPDNVTVIAAEAFKGCTKLETIKIPNTVTAIGYEAFKGCKNLKSINIPNGVTNELQDTFMGCTSLTSVTIPNSVPAIRGAFSGCTSLTSVVIPDNGIYLYDDAFRGCTSLQSVTLPDSIKTVTSRAFYECGNDIEITYKGKIYKAKDYSLLERRVRGY